MIMVPMSPCRRDQCGYFIDKFDGIKLDKSLTGVARFWQPIDEPGTNL